MADRVFSLQFDLKANVGPLKNALEGLQGSISKLKIPDNFKKGLETTATKLANEINNFETIAGKGFQNMGDISKAENSFGKITSLFTKLKNDISHIKGIDAEKLIPSETLNKLKGLQNAWTEIEKNAARASASIQSQIEKENAALTKQETILKNLQTSRKNLQAENKTLQKNRQTTENNLATLLGQRGNLTNKLTSLEINGFKNTQQYKNFATDLKDVNREISSTRKELTNLDGTISSNKAKINDYGRQIKEAGKSFDEIQAKVKELEAALKTPADTSKLRQMLADFKNVDISKIPTDLNSLKQMLSSLTGEELEKIKAQFNGVSEAASKAEPAIRKTGTALNTTAQQGRELTERARDLQMLADRAKYFFSITNSIQLFRRVVHSAVNTVKELDAVMTQAAVVTKFDVGDMWKQLPEYSKRASELGATTKGAYEATTLYLQQGLDIADAIGVSNETLKMAKIAGMDYATATDYMTSALRGFNMEVNELSAQRVNDVYSQLAAKSASNTEELSIAMSKTAPLAHNAGMEIEETAAILANMIETTREAPETLGTAMKTVIARFQELKKSPSEIGEVDGEIVDANKIETALKSIGVALRDTSGQFRDFDDVIFDISAKWGSLDKNTQRYIATIAAGSRQQSRFIAMVGDYNRTMELVQLANESAGASTEQFEKTQDSLESKLNRLKNAWDVFTMGLANNQIIKAAVDGLTALIDVINKLTTTLSGGEHGSGFVKSLLNLGALGAGIVAARNLLNGFFAFILKTAKTTGTAAGANLGKGIISGMSVANFGKGATGFIDGLSASLNSLVDKQLVSKNFFKGKMSDLLINTDAKELVKKAHLNYEQSIWSEFGEVIGPDPEVIEAYHQLAESLELTESAQEAAIFMTEQGVNADLAKAAAAAGVTKEEADKFIAEKMAAGATKEAAAAELEAMGIERARAANLKGMVGNLRNSFAKLGQSIASFITSPLGIALAALAAIAITVVAIKANSLEGRLNQAKKASQEAAESAETAKKAYDDLLNGQQTYNELQDKLSELTYGTKEFTQALLEANAQVLELKQQFSDLKLGIGEQGQLIILPESWENIVEKTRKTALARQGVQLSTDQDVADIEYEKNRKEINRQYINQIREDYSWSANRRMAVQRFENDVSYDQFDDWDNRLKGLDIIAQARQSDLDMLEFIYQKEAQARRMSQISPWTTELENAQAVNSMIATQYDRLYQLWSKEQGEKGLTTKEAYQEEYAKNFIISDEELKNLSYDQLAEGLFQLSFEDIGKQYDKIISKYNDTSMKGLVDAFSGQVSEDFFDFFKDIDLADVAKLDNETLQKHLEKSLEGTETTLEQVAEDFGFVLENGEVDIEGFLNTLKEGAAEAEQAWNLTQQQTSKNLKEAGFSEPSAIFSGMSIDSQKFFSNMFNTAIDNFGADSDFSRRFGVVMAAMLKTADLSEVKEVFGNIDLSNSIKAFNQLQDVVKNTTGELKKGAKEILKAEEFSTENLFKTFYQSGALDEIKEQLEEVADAEGNIHGQNLEDLRESCAGLDEYLKTGTVSANGLARAINLIGQGNSINVFNNNLLIALSTVNTISDKLAEMYGKIDSYELPRSPSEGIELLQEQVNSLNELITKGIISGPQIEYLYKQITGQTLEEADWEPEEYLQKLLEFNEDMQKYFGDGKNPLQGDAFGWGDTTREGFIEGFDKTTDDLIQEIKKSYPDIGEDAANYMLQEFLTHWGPGITKKLEENDLKQIAENYTNTVFGRGTDKEGRSIKGSFYTRDTRQGEKKFGVLTNETVKVFAELDGKEVEEEYQDLCEDLEEDEVYIRVDVTDKDGNPLSGEQLLNNLNSGFNEQGLDFQTFLQENGVIDITYKEDGSIQSITGNLENAKDVASQIGIPEENFIAALEAIDKFEGFEPPELTLLTDGALSSLEEIQDAINDISASHLTKTIISAINSAVTTATFKLQTIQTKLNNMTSKPYEIVVNFKMGSFALGNLTGGKSKSTTSSDLNNPKKTPYGTEAKGSPGLTKNELALTGEEGVELAYNEDGAFLLGVNGPQFAYLKKGTVIFPHEKTKKILKNRNIHTKFNNYEKGTDKYYVGGYYYGSSTPSKEKTTSKTTTESKTSTPSATKAVKNYTEETKKANEETEKWENSVDFIYNLLEKINKEARNREKLEKRYQRLIKNNKGSLKEIRDLYNAQLISLSKQSELENERIKKRKEEMAALIEKNKDLSSYAWFNEDGTIEVDWEKVDAITNEDTGEAFEKFLSEMERIRDDIQEAEDSLEDIQDATDELAEIGRDARAELEDRMIDALVTLREKSIEEQEKINDSIDEANSNLIDAIENNISQIRKDREREKARTDLEDKERRLAYLKQDTTGGNILEIKQLEKELNEAKQDYVDTLVDDKLQEMKEQNDAAKEQRDKQIELAKSQLEYQKENGIIANKANELISQFRSDYIGKDSYNVEDTDIYRILSEAENTDAMGLISRGDWEASLGETLTDIIVGKGGGGKAEDYISGMKSAAGAKNKNEFSRLELERNEIVENKTAFTSSYREGRSEKLENKDYMAEINKILAKKDLVRGDWESLFKLAGLRDQKIAGLDLSSLPYEIDNPDTFAYILEKFAERYMLGSYASGGLVDFTGPAYLHGSKGNPEVVLNASQTKAFMQLRDILSQIDLNSAGTGVGTYNFDIDIHVDEIANDYDVDQMAAKLEKSLYEKAMYRNVNQLNFLK